MPEVRRAQLRRWSLQSACLAVVRAEIPSAPCGPSHERLYCASVRCLARPCSQLTSVVERCNLGCEPVVLCVESHRHPLAVRRHAPTHTRGNTHQQDSSSPRSVGRPDSHQRGQVLDRIPRARWSTSLRWRLETQRLFCAWAFSRSLLRWWLRFRFWPYCRPQLPETQAPILGRTP